MSIGFRAIHWVLPLSAVAAGGLSPAIAQSFTAQCAMCHQAGGVGLAGQFPRLAGRAAAIAATEAGRHYLIMVPLFGLSGPITADGQSISGFMPAMTALNDQDLAKVLNEVVAMGATGKKPKPFTAAEIKAVRGSGPHSTGDVAAARAALEKDGALPK